MAEKSIYFDCGAGICGSMILGALVDAGLDFEVLKGELAKLNVTDYEITAERVVKKSISATLIKVSCGEKQPHRHLRHIVEIINQSDFASDVKQTSIEVFTRLAQAEAKIHGTTVEKIHFHEVGAVDAIVDIVGSVLGLKMLGITRVFASSIATGFGTVNCAHGRMPVPAPATAELLKGVPAYAGEVEKELTTPTGAALISTLCEKFGPAPAMVTDDIGYGAGEYELSIPNILRIQIGVLAAASSSDWLTEELFLLESNIDDMNPEFYDSVFESFLRAGALDVYATPVQMKKNRPAVKLSVLSPPEKKDALTEIFFRETTTLGLRVQPLERRSLRREIREIETELGPMRVKFSFFNGSLRQAAPEYEDCKKISLEKSIPVRDVYERAQTAARAALDMDAGAEKS